jgi:hypothetical protein
VSDSSIDRHLGTERYLRKYQNGVEALKDILVSRVRGLILLKTYWAFIQSYLQPVLSEVHLAKPSYRAALGVSLMTPDGHT